MSTSSSATRFATRREQLQYLENANRREVLRNLRRRIARAEAMSDEVDVPIKITRISGAKRPMWYDANDNPSVFKRGFYSNKVDKKYWKGFGEGNWGSVAKTALAEAGVAAGLYVLNDQLYSEEGNPLITKVLLPIGAKISDAANWLYDAITGNKHEEDQPTPTSIGGPPAIGIVAIGAPASAQRDAGFLGVYPPVAKDQYGFPNHITHGTFQPW
jgi:hypothetical protein